MFSKLIRLDSNSEDYSECRHGVRFDNVYSCQDCDEEDDTDIDKCLNCGRYRASSSLNRDQVCAKGCKNPNEY